MHIGEILENRGDFEAATQAYESAAAIDPNPEVEKRLEALRNRAALEKLPAEYRAIEQAAQVTRADLAALVGIRLGQLLQNAASGDAGLITDIRSNWAQTWIVAVARAGVMEPFANHAFQPRAIVRRADLAQATAKLLAIIGASRPAAGEGMGIGAPALQRSRADAPGVSGRFPGGRARTCCRWARATRSSHRERLRAPKPSRPSETGDARRPEMTALTPANQLTLLRMLLIPAFVILVVYGHFGWALVVFGVAGITDALDGVIARRSGQKTNLGAWLDPMADKLLLVTTFVVLTLPNLGLANRLPIWLTVLIISRDVGIVLTVAIVNSGHGAADVPSVDVRQGGDRHLHSHGRRRAVVQLPGVSLGLRGPVRLRVADHHADFRISLHLACGADHRRPGVEGVDVMRMRS